MIRKIEIETEKGKYEITNFFGDVMLTVSKGFFKKKIYEIKKEEGRFVVSDEKEGTVELNENGEIVSIEMDSENFSWIEDFLKKNFGLFKHSVEAVGK